MPIKVIERISIVTVDILYWMPDYENILQQFIWQTKDTIPEYPRVHKFLNFWHNNIDAVISEINIAESAGNYRPVKEVYELY